MDQLKFLDALAKCFEKLPNVGKKTASRYAYYIVESLSDQEVQDFSKVLVDTKEKVHHCSKCGMLTTSDICPICSDSTRDTTKIMVVKDTKNVLAVEKSKTYNGLYHCLNGLINPSTGVGPDDLNLDSLDKRINNNTEVILATSFTPEGETTALYLEKILLKKGYNVSRIGYGIPAGGDLEFIDELTLRRAIDSRVKSEK